jgi:WD40 repeat protein
MENNGQYSQEKKYLAFISYRHADNKEDGRQWATWLHQAIETYEVPKELVGNKNTLGREIPARIYPIFRDEEELPADADLSNVITRALDDSHLLVVLCSPRAVSSPYVAEEIDYFKQQGNSDSIIAAIIDGEPNTSWDDSKSALGFSKEDECFPLPLQFEYDESGQATTKHAEPIAADFRITENGNCTQGWTNSEAYRQDLKKQGIASKDISNKVELYEKQQHLMLLKVIAGILGVPLGQLTQRDKEYQLTLERQKAKKLRQWLSAVAMLAIISIGAGIWAYINQQEAIKQESIAQQQTIEAKKQESIAQQQTIEAKKQESIAIEKRDEALLTQSRFLMDLAKQKNKDGDYDTALLLALNAIPGEYGGDRPSIPFLSELRYATLHADLHTKLHRKNLNGKISLSPDGKTFIIPEENGPSYIWSLDTGKALNIYHPSDKYKIKRSVFNYDGNIIASTSGYTVYLWSIEDKKLITTLKPDSKNSVQIVEMAFSRDNTKLALLYSDDSILVFDVSTSKKLFTFKNDHNSSYNLSNFYTLRFNHDDSLLYMASGNNDVYVWSLITGKLAFTAKSAKDNSLSHFWSRHPVMTDNNTLITWDSEGTHIWNLATEEKQDIKNVHIIVGGSGKYIAYLPASISPYGSYSPENEDKAKYPSIFNRETKTQVELPHQFQAVKDILFSPDGRKVLTVDTLNNRFLWSTKTGQKLKSFKTNFAHQLIFSKDSKFIIALEQSNEIISIYSAEILRENIPSDIKGTSSFYFGELNTGYTMSNSSDSNAKNRVVEAQFTSLSTGKLLKKYPLPCNNPSEYLSSGKTYLVISCRPSNQWVLYSMLSGEKLLDEITGSEPPIFSDNDAYYFIKDGIGHYSIFQLGQKEPIITFDWEDNISSLAFSPDNTLLITSNEDGSVVQHSLLDSSKKNIITIEEKIAAIKYSPDGTLLAINTEKKNLHILSLNNNKIIKTISAEKGYEYFLFSHNNDYLFTINKQKEATLNIWPLKSDAKPTSIFNINGWGNDQIKLNKNNNLFIIKNDKEVWSLDTMQKVLTFDYSHEISALDFTPDGRQVIAITNSGLIQKWPLYEDNLIEQAKKKLTLNRICLTAEERVSYYLPPLNEAERKIRGCL